MLDMDPFAEIAPYPGPVLIVHGTRDHIVQPDYACRAYEEYRNRGVAGASVCLEMIEGGGHGVSRGHDRRAIEKLVQFAKVEGLPQKIQ